MRNKDCKDCGAFPCIKEMEDEAYGDRRHWAGLISQPHGCDSWTDITIKSDILRSTGGPTLEGEK